MPLDMLDCDTGTKTAAKRRDIPCIFADGKRDDLPGLVAAFENKDVEYAGKIYRPNEDISLNDIHLRMSRYIVIQLEDGQFMDMTGKIGKTYTAAEGFPHVVAVCPEGSRNVSMDSCDCEGMPPLSEWEQSGGG